MLSLAHPISKGLTGIQANEDVRAQYRYLDLRRTDLADNIKLRSKVAHIFRNYLHDAGTSLHRRATL